MVEQGPKFKITSKGPTLYNEDSPSNKYTETTHKLENPDGETVVEVSLYHEPSYYAVGWEDGSITPNNFFSDVQNLVDAIKDRPDIYPLETKPLRGLLYGLEGKLIPVKQDVFEPLDELDQDGVSFARFSTPYGDFFWGRNESDRQAVQLSVLTHNNFPRELVDFVASHSQQKMDRSLLEELLEKVGAQASRRMAEKAVPEQ